MFMLDRVAMTAAVTENEVMDTLEEAFRLFEAGDFYMPDRISVVQGDDTLLYMPCYAGDYFGTKLLTLFPGNQAKGFPYIHGLYILHKRDNGEIIAQMDGSFLTALRTGAAGGIGMRHFSREDTRSAGIVGCGTQGFQQALTVCKVRPIEDLYLFDAHHSDLPGWAARLSARLQNPKPRIHICNRVEELLEGSEIVVTATTAMTPVLPDDPALLGGKLFVAIGSYKPNMRELPPAIWQVTDAAITELPYAIEESGDLSQPIEEGWLRERHIQYTGRLIFGNDKPVPGNGRSVLYKSVGMGLFDLMAAKLIYEKLAR